MSYKILYRTVNIAKLNSNNIIEELQYMLPYLIGFPGKIEEIDFIFIYIYYIPIIDISKLIYRGKS